MKIICKTPFPEVTITGFANPNRSTGVWMAGDIIEVNDKNKVIVGHLLHTPEWEIVPEGERKNRKSKLEE